MGGSARQTGRWGKEVVEEITATYTVIQPPTRPTQLQAGSTGGPGDFLGRRLGVLLIEAGLHPARDLLHDHHRVVETGGSPIPTPVRETPRRRLRSF
jgi:hypothetical protein